MVKVNIMNNIAVRVSCYSFVRLYHYFEILIPNSQEMTLHKLNVSTLHSCELSLKHIEHAG